MKINAIKISNFIGIEEFELKPSMVTILKGPKASGKSSVLEAIETAATNIKRRTEVIRHGENEASLFIQTDNGLEIDRRIRNDKADYLKLRQEGEGIKSTEAELRKFISGEIFRPLDFINMKPAEQTQIILSMIQMNYGPKDFIEWFGSEEILSKINTDKHVLQILADIESKLYAERQEINRTISLLEAQAKGIENALPDNYDGHVWRAQSLQDAFNKVNDAQKVNNYIKEAKELQEGLEVSINAVKFEQSQQVFEIDKKYESAGSDIEADLKYLEDRIVDLKKNIEASSRVMNNNLVDLDTELEAKIQALKLDYANKKTLEIDAFLLSKSKYELSISDCEIDIQKRQNEAKSLDELKKMEVEGIAKQYAEKEETVKARAGKAAEFLTTHVEIDLDPLQKNADELAKMKEYLAEWDRMIELRNGQIKDKKDYSNKLTTLIETARNKPTELLKQHELPIEGIGVDANGLIRINGTLLDGLSDGEKLEAAFKIALQRIGELRVICIDGMEKLNESEQIKVLEICAENDVQVFVTITTDTESGNYEIKGGL